MSSSVVRYIHQFYKRYTEGCPIIETDVSAAVMEKKDGFNVRDISVIREIIDDHMCDRPITIDTSKKLELERDEFELFLKQANYDMDVFRVWLMLGGEGGWATRTKRKQHVTNTARTTHQYSFKKV